MIKTYAKVFWTLEDVRSLKPNWSVKRTKEFLRLNEKSLTDRLIENGWEVIEAAISCDEAREQTEKTLEIRNG